MNWLRGLSRLAKATTPKRQQSPAPVREVQASGRGGLIAHRPDSFPFEVTGESHYQDALAAIVGGHNREGHAFVCRADLRPEPGNRFDPNAIRVVIQGRTVGYVPRTATARIHAAIAELGPLVATARIDGGWRTNQHDAGHFGVKLAIPGRGPITLA